LPCQSCGKVNLVGAKFCSECSARLIAGCPSCGAQNAPGATFCSKCGTRLEPGAGAGARDEARAIFTRIGAGAFLRQLDALPSGPGAAEPRTPPPPTASTAAAPVASAESAPTP
jgi:ribosomal protein L40E